MSVLKSPVPVFLFGQRKKVKKNVFFFVFVPKSTSAALKKWKPVFTLSAGKTAVAAKKMPSNAAIGQRFLVFFAISTDTCYPSGRDGYARKWPEAVGDFPNASLVRARQLLRLSLSD